MNASEASDSLSGSEEIRFAVVLNGGVSLAVWMGGVVHELDEVTRKRGPYGPLMDRLDVAARADVIAGTSAGGINGAALALAQLNRHADLSCLRDMWAEQGRMETLLHQPFRGKPSSLLRGDAYFLPEIQKAMERLTRDWEGFDPPSRPLTDLARPMDLTITTTLLSGSTQSTADALGQVLPQQRHDGRFEFFQGVDDADQECGDFPRSSVDGGHPIAAALALAARSSASFPVAFEPSYVPVKRGCECPDARRPRSVSGPSAPRLLQDWDSTRPDMSDYADWGGKSGDHSRYAVDGGLLANTPTRQALDAVERMKAMRPVERVMLLVYPHAPRLDLDRPAKSTDMPSVPATMMQVLGALTNEGSRTFVDAVEDHNQSAAVRRGTRADVLRTELSGHGSVSGSDGVTNLNDLARRLFEHYRKQRFRRTLRDLVRRIEIPSGLSFESVSEAAEAAQSDWQQADGRVVSPYVPSSLGESMELPESGWEWGTSTALDLADTALEVIGHLDELSPELSGLLKVNTRREAVHGAAASLRRIRERLEKPWREETDLAAIVPNKQYWLLRLDTYARAMLPASRQPASWPARRVQIAGRLGQPPTEREIRADEVVEAVPVECGSDVAKAVTSVVNALRELIVAFTQLPDEGQELVRGLMRPYDRLVSSVQRPALDEQLFKTLLQLHVVSWTVGDGDLTESTHPIRLIQISADVKHEWAHASRTLEEKLGGASLARFSGFLKASWRMNDWAWGRFDASAMLLKVILTPDRVRRFARRSGLNAKQVVSQLAEATFGSSAAPPNSALRTASEEQVTRLLEGGEVGLVLDRLVAYLVLARHTDIIFDEVPAIAGAIRADQSDGASSRSRGPRFLTDNEALINELKDPSRRGDLSLGERALESFDRAGIGREPLDREAASDQMIRTTVTAASVGATLIDSPASGLGRFNPVTRAVRGAMRLPYWLTIGLTSGGTTAALFAILGLAIGGSLLAMALLGALTGTLASLAGSLGAGAAVLAFGYAAMRTGSFLHSVVLLGAGAPLLIIGARQVNAVAGATGGDRWTGATSVGAVVVLTLGLVVLGTLPTPLRSPLSMAVRTEARVRASARGWLRRARRRWFTPPLPKVRWALLLGGAGLSCALILGLARLPSLTLSRPSLETLATLGPKAYAGVALVGVVPALVGGFLLRTWRMVEKSPGNLLRRSWDRLRAWTGHGNPPAHGWHAPAVSLPSGVTVGWSWVYGAAIAAVAYFLVRKRALNDVIEGAPSSGINSPYVWVVLAQAAAILLLLVVPTLTPYLTARRISRQVLGLAKAGLFLPPAKDITGEPVPREPRAELLAWLHNRDRAVRYLVRRHRFLNVTKLVLTSPGRTLAMKVEDERMANAPLAVRAAPSGASPRPTQRSTTDRPGRLRRGLRRLLGNRRQE